MNSWLAEVSALTERGESCVLITVVATRGSVPREAGTRMVVTEDSCSGTIGGGHLEYRAIDIARSQLSDATRPASFAERFPLGASLGQCCGGLVYLLFEHLTASAPAWLDFLREHDAQTQPVVMVTQLLPDKDDPRTIASIRRLAVSEQSATGELVGVQQCAVEYARDRLFASQADAVNTIVGSQLMAKLLPVEQAAANDKETFFSAPLVFETLQPDAFTVCLFGAGHVGQAIVNVLSVLPCTIRWIDSRPDQFPDTLPANVHTVVTDQPHFELDEIPPDSFVLIMTHSHALDETICERALKRDDLAYCGLIGSASKRRNFTRRFESRGMSVSCIDRLTCPIGLPGLTGKHPGEIAIAVSAELLHIRESGIRAWAKQASATTPALETA